MDRPEIQSNWTLREIREAITGGLEPRDVGGDDARRGRPPPIDGYLPPFLHSGRTNAQALIARAEEYANDEFAAEVAKVRQCPIMLEVPGERVGATSPQIEGELKVHIEQNRVDLEGAQQHVKESDVAYAHHLQQARAVKPAGGWKNSAQMALMAFIVVLLDGGIGATMLAHALGPRRAIVTCLVLAFFAFAGGALSAWFRLRPVDYRLDTSARRTRQWVFALITAVATVLILYIGACYRAAWIEGLSGQSDEILAKFWAPGHVLFNPDVLALALLGLLGFLAGVWECSTYFRGYGPALREAGVECERAHEARKELVDGHKDYVKTEVGKAHASVDTLRQETDDWVRQMPGFRDEAAATAAEANRRRGATVQVLGNVCAEYADGFHEVAAFDRARTSRIALSYQTIEVPVPFDSACEAAAIAIRDAGAATNKAHLDLDGLLRQALARIDELAGLRPATPEAPRVPFRQPTP